MIGKLYENADDAIMHGVNKVVRAYNWTTGGTKAELANGLLTVAPVLESTMLSISHGFSSLSILLWLAHSHIYQKINTKIERQEVKALEQGILSTHVEEYKKTCMAQGCTWGGLSVFVGGLTTYVPQNEIEATAYTCVSIGDGLRGFSFYVMRADYHPPRKNCLKRGLEKLEQRIAEYRAKPAHAPVPVAVRAAGKVSA